MGISSASALCGVCFWGFSSNLPQIDCESFLGHFISASLINWLSHMRVVINMCEPSCEKIKKMFSGVLRDKPCGSSLSLSMLISSCLHLNASSHTHYYVKEWIKKIPQDAGLIPRLSVLTMCLSSLLSPQPHSTICKSSGPQWNRVTTEEEHKVNLKKMCPHMFCVLCDTLMVSMVKG